MAKFALLLAGSILALFILAYVVYVIFFPLVRTIGGGFQILRIHGLKKVKATDQERLPGFFTPDLEVGPTMADGGEKTEKEESNAPEKHKPPVE